MDPHSATEPSPPDEGALGPLLAAQERGTTSHMIAGSISVHEAPEGESGAACTPADPQDCGNGQIQSFISDVDNDGSDYDPTQAQEEEGSDEDIRSSRKKQAKKDEIDPLNIEELHSDWKTWESIYSDLLRKKEISGLDERQTANLSFCRDSLEALVKEMPASDPLRKEYVRLLAQSTPSPLPEARVRKRKSNGPSTVRAKKARLTQPCESQSSIPTEAKRVSRQATNQNVSSQINTQLQNFRDQGQQAKIEPARLKSEVKNMESALAAFGDKLITAKDGCWLIQGMKTPLYNYQFDGAGWVMRRERTHPNPDNPRGGILADEMGCGKTITMLAVLVAKPAPKSYRVKASLLLVQSAQMAKQWEKQIRKHCTKRGLSVCLYTRKSGLNTQSLAVNQVFILTYSEVQRAWARLGGTSRDRAATAKDDSDEEDSDDIDDTDQEQRLFDTNFYRLILDECQFIKKHNSATAKAVFQIKSKIQWLISATPAPNKMDEYFSYFKILGLSHTEDLSAFRRYWLDKKGRVDGRDNLEVGLEKFQLHRTHETKIAGTPIFDNVPDSVYDEQTVTMSHDERAIYDAVVAPVEREQRELAAKIRKQQKLMAEEGAEVAEADIIQKTKGAEAKILQLHKLTAHPFLLETIMQRKEFSATQMVEIRGLMRRFAASAVCDQAEDVFVKVEARGYGRSPSIDCQSLVSASASTGDEEAGMDVQLGYTLGSKSAERRCHLCPGEKIPIEAILCECGHAFCRKHFDFTIEMSRKDSPEGPSSCSVCEGPIGIHKEVDQTEFATARAAFIAAGGLSIGGIDRSAPRGDKRTRKRGDDFNGYQPKGAHSFWLAVSDKAHPKEPILQSSKTQEVLDTIDRWQNRAPDDKIIIFTQWVMMGKILGRSLQDKGIEFLYYFGEMSIRERDRNLRTFETNKDIKVIIMGFKCASQGLDMYYANRVILVDPWWNEDGEAQGFARVKRKIQKKTTFFLRLMAENSIDMRIADIKKSKREMTQRLRKEDNPSRRYEIEMEYALKTCEMKLSANTTEKKPLEDPEQDATKEQRTVKFDAKRGHKDAAVTEQQQIKSRVHNGVSDEQYERETKIDEPKVSQDAGGESEVDEITYRKSATLATPDPGSAAKNTDGTDHLIDREAPADAMDIDPTPANRAMEKHQGVSMGEGSSKAVVEA